MSFGATAPTKATKANNAIGIGEDFSASSANQAGGSVWGGQSGYLQDLYSRGQGLVNNFGAYQTQASDLMSQAGGGLSQLMNPGINPQLGAYSGEVQRNLEQNLLPSIRGGAGMAGQMGGSRQGIGEGLALSQSNQQITDMAANLYSEDMNRMLGAIGLSPNIANATLGVPWYALQQYSGLLGSPTVLGGAGSSSSVSQGYNYSRDTGGGGGGGGGGFNIGIA